MRTVNVNYEKYSHYIGRPSILSNPFSHKPSKYPNVVMVKTVWEAIEKFEVYARSTPKVMEAIKKLPEDATLGCFCKPRPGSPAFGRTPCHGDIIITLWKELNGAK